LARLSVNGSLAKSQRVLKNRMIWLCEIYNTHEDCAVFLRVFASVHDEHWSVAGRFGFGLED